MPVKAWTESSLRRMCWPTSWGTLGGAPRGQSDPLSPPPHQVRRHELTTKISLQVRLSGEVALVCCGTSNPCRRIRSSLCWSALCLALCLCQERRKDHNTTAVHQRRDGIQPFYCFRTMYTHCCSIRTLLAFEERKRKHGLDSTSCTCGRNNSRASCHDIPKILRLMKTYAFGCPPPPASLLSLLPTHPADHSLSSLLTQEDCASGCCMCNVTRSTGKEVASSSSSKALSITI